MATDQLSKIETDEGDFMVLTKIRYLGFLKMPRSSVMPFKTAQFLATPGFQIHYNTSDPNILREWHEMIVALVQKGLFQALADGARVGAVPISRRQEAFTAIRQAFRISQTPNTALEPTASVWARS